MADVSPRVQANKQLDVIYARRAQEAADARKLYQDAAIRRTEQARIDEKIRQDSEFVRLEQARSLAAEQRARDISNARQAVIDAEDFQKALTDARNANEPLLRGTLVDLVA